MPLNPELISVEADAILEQVAAQLRRESLAPASEATRFYTGPARGAGGSTAGMGPRPNLQATGDASEISYHLERLQSLLNSNLEPGIPKIGGSPPRAGTWRGIWGYAAIQALRRLLWWHTRSIQFFAAAVGEQFRAELTALEALACAQQAAREEIAAIRKEVGELRAAVSGSRPTGA